MAFPPELKMNSVPSGKAGVFDAIRKETGLALRYISTLSILVFTNKASAKPFTNPGTSSGCVRAVMGRAWSFPPEARPEERDFLVSFVTGNPLLSSSPLFLSHLFIYLFIYVCVWVYKHTHTGVCGDKRPSDPLQLELRGLVSCPTWVLETKLPSSKGTGSALSH